MVGISNPIEAMIGTLIVIDEVKEKMAGTKLASYDWRPMEAVDGVEYEVTELIREAFERCEEPMDVLIVVTVASVLMSRQNAMIKAEVASQTVPPVDTRKWWHRFKSNR